MIRVFNTRVFAAKNPNRHCNPVPRRKLVAAALFALSAPSVFISLAYAQPVGGQVSAGSGAIAQSGTNTTVTQTTQNLAIDWQSFSIGSNEAVHFNQPNASSIALNRVLGQDPSSILGSLSANGQVFVLNPNGVLFGTTAQVNVGGLVASSLSLSNADFMAGRYSFSNGGTAGSVVNQGTLTAASGGYIALLAPEVRNEGIITATLGTALLGAGDKVTLNLNNGSLISYTADQGALNALAENKLLIQADGGQVILSARAADALSTAVVNNTGIIEARSIKNVGGIIRLDGGDSGTVNVSGTLDASGLHTGENGGTVKVLGKDVALLDGAIINASGDIGGGTVLVGGNYQGSGPEQNATATFVAPTAQINADAVTNGNGGRLIVWSNDATRVYGSLTAKGGALSGNGGFIETSGKKYLEVTQGADASAAHGISGTWLLDPNDIIIQATGVNTNVTASPNFTSTNDSAIVTTGSITTALNAGTSVVVTTASAGTNTQLGNITVNGAITGGQNNNTTQTLTLNASNNIDVNAAVAGGGNANTRLNVSFNATSGAVNLNAGANLSARIGNVTINSATLNQVAGTTLTGTSLTVNNSGSGTMAGVIGGATTITKQGAGALTLSGANTYTGVTTISAGTLLLGSTSALGTVAGRTNIGAGATLDLNGFTLATAEPLTLNGTGVGGTAGALTNSSATAATYRGLITLGSDSSIVANNGNLVLSNAGTITGGGFGLTMDGANTASSLNSAIGTGAGTLTKNGTGTWTLTRASTFTGTTTVNAGTLTAGVANTLSSGALTVNGGTYNLGTFSDTIGAVTLTNGSITGTTGVLTGTSYNVSNGTISAILAGAVPLTKTTAGTVTLTGTNTYTGVTTINAGVLSVATIGNGGVAGNLGAAAAAATNLVLGGGTLQYAGVTAPTNRAYTLTAGTTSSIDVSVAATNLTMSGAGANTTGALTKVGAGTLTLSGANLYTGLTTVSAGTLAYGINNALSTGAVTVDNGTLAMGTFSDSVGTVTVANGGSITGTTGVLTSTGSFEMQSGSVSAILAGAVPLNKTTTGTVTLSGTNTYTGVTSINAGVLSVGTIGNGGVAGNLGAATSVAANLVLGGGTLQYTGATAATNRAFTLTTGTTSSIDASIGATTLTMSGSGANTTGALTKIGAGTLLLSGTNLYTGATTINAGTLTASGGAAIADTSAVTVAGSATLNLANSETIGSLAGAGNVTLNANTLTAGGDNTSTSYSGVASGTGGLTMAGTGIWTLSGNSTYSGLTTISAGTLKLGAAGGATNTPLGTTAAGTIVTAGAALDLNGFTLGTAESLTLNGTGISGGGALTNSTATAATYSGAITLGSNSSIVVGSGNSLTASGAINGANALDVLGGGTVTLGGSIGNSTPLASFSGAAGTTLNINGGVVSTSGAQTYSGATTFGAATTLTAGSISATGAVTATAGTLTLATGAGNATFTNTANDFGTVRATSGANVSLIDANALTIAGINVTGLVDVRTQTGDLTLTTASIATTSTSANAVTLVADVASTPDATGSGGNVKNTGNVAITTGAGGAWRIYTGNPTGTSRGGLTETGKQYNVDDVSDPLAFGNRIYFRIQPTLTLTADNTSKTYGDANPSFTYSYSTLIDGDSIGAAISSGPSYAVSGSTSRSGELTAGTFHIITPSAATASSLGYTLNYAAGTLTVNQRAIANVTGIAANNKTYDGNTSATLDTSGASFTSMIAGDSLSVGTATGVFGDKNAATGKTVNISGITLGGTDAGNYTLTSNIASTTADIGKAAIANVTGIAANNKTYDGNTSATLDTSGASFTSMIAGDSLSVGAATGVFGDKNAATGKTVSISGITLGGTDAGNYTLTSNIASTTADIGKAVIANVTGIAANNKTYDGNTSATLDTSGASFTSMIAGDSLSVGAATGAFGDKNAATGKTVNISGITLGGTDAGNYTLTSNIASTTANINPYVINLIGSRTYDTTTIMNASTFGKFYGVNGESLTITGIGSLADKNVGAGKVITQGSLALGDGTGLASNYTLIGGNHRATINAASLVITGMTAANKVYDATTAATLVGTAAVSPLSGDSVALSGTGVGVFRTKNVGNGNSVTVNGYTLSGTDAGNYTLTQPTGLSANVTKAPLTITGTPVAASRQYDGTTLTTIGGATVNGVFSGDTAYLIGIFTTPSVGTNKTVSVALTGSSAGNYSYTSIPNLTASITQRALTYSGTPVAASRVYDGTLTTSVTGITLSGVVASDIYSVTVSGLFADKNVGTGKAVTSVLSGSKAGNYSLAPMGGLTADITAASLAVTGVTAMNKVYNATAAATLGGTAAISVFGTDKVILGGTGSGVFSDKNVGTGKVVTVSGYTISGADAGNYSLVQPAGLTANITQLALTLTGTPVAASRVYDGTLATTISGASLAGVLSGDSVGLGGLFADPNVGTAKPVTLAMTGTDGGNYSITQPGGLTADITARSLIVVANDNSMIFSGTIPALTYTVGGAGLVGADTLASVFAGLLNVNVTGVPSGGTAPITQGSVVLTVGPGGNYTIGSFVNGVMTVQ